MNLSNYILQCSLLVTDFSSISFAFIFQNKPVLFYLIDYKDNIDSIEKKIMKNDVKPPFGDYFIDKNKLIEKIKYYISKNFKITKELKKEYESIFYYKKNITQRIVEIINQIISKK